jgi:hypothetical protein
MVLMFCEQCGKQIDNAALFCNFCGAKTRNTAGGGNIPVGSNTHQGPGPAVNQNTRYEQAEYGVPHCKFERTTHGFKVSFNKATSGRISWAVLTGFPGIPIAMLVLGLAIGGFGVFMGVVLPIVGIVLLLKCNETKIEVTPDAIIIDNAILSRKDFVSFSVGGTTEQKGRRPSVEARTIGYTYGLRSFSFGGVWKNPGEAEEVANALNAHLRNTPRAGDAAQPSPEVLRILARPTDF